MFIVPIDNAFQLIVDPVDVHLVPFDVKLFVRWLQKYCFVQWKIERMAVDVVSIDTSVFDRSTLTVVLG